ncbi:hypothetical protein [Azospirillum soli]|uniref:hypothetical protein n=1 Tax=Azospirillum soli TaxID=1304799 RepID=UPI0031B7FAB7|nr:hypothetical protein [Azospirillum soli]
MSSRLSPIALPLIAAAALLGMTACADPANDTALAAQSALVGMPKGTLLSCAGVPERQTASGKLEYFTYQAGSVTYYAPSPPIGYGWSRRALDYDPWDYYPPFPGDVVDQRCEATFTLAGGVVERLVYRASSARACVAIVQNCLALVPQRTISKGPQ